MGRWLDSFGVGVPMVEFEDDTGRRVPVPRSEFARLGAQFDAPTLPEGAQSAFGQGALAPPLPEIDLSAVNASDVAAAQLDAGGAGAPSAFGGVPGVNIDAISGATPRTSPPGAFAERQSRDSMAGSDTPGVHGVQQFVADQAVELAKYQPQQVGGGQAVVSQETPDQATEANQGAQWAAYGAGGGVPPASLREQALVGATDVAQREADANAATIMAAGQGMDIAEAQRQKDLEQDRAEYDRLNREYGALVKKEADAKIDPGRKYARMSTGSKVLAVLGVVLSGAGSVLKKQGDKNPALDILMAAFNEDIALQMDERAQMGRNVATKRGQLDKFAEVAQTRDGIRLAGISTMATREARRLREIAAKSASERVQFDALGLAADLEGAAAAAQAQGAQAEFDNYLAAKEDDRKERELQLKERKAAGGGGGAGGYGKGGGELAGSYTSLDQIAQIDKKLVQQAVLMPDGSFVIASSKEAKKEADAALVQSGQLVQNIDRALTKLTKSPGFAEKIKNRGGWTTEDVAVIQQELAQLQGSGKNYLGLGALSESDFELMKQMGADVNSVTQFFEQAFPKLQNWRRGVVQDGASKIRQYVGRDVNEDTAFGAAPERPRAKTVDEWTSEITSEPPELENSHNVSSGGETRQVTTYEYKVPTPAATKETLRGMRETALSDGWSDDKWSAHLDRIDQDHKLQAVRLAGKADGLDQRAKEAEKKGGKGKAEALQLRKKAAAARSASADYLKLRDVVAEQRKAKIERDRKKAADAAGQKEFKKVQREAVGSKI